MMRREVTIAIGFSICLFLVSSLNESIKSAARALDILQQRSDEPQQTVAMGLVEQEVQQPNNNDGQPSIAVETTDQEHLPEITLTVEDRGSMFSVPLDQWKPTQVDDRQKLKVYVYDSIPKEYTSDIISCMKDMAKVDDPNSFSSLTTKMADVALVHLFETYPGRTHDPHQADIFFVPYPHAGHCYCAEGWKVGCGQVKDRALDQVFHSLTYYNETTAPRHLFVLSGHQYFTHPRLLSQPLKLLGGNLSPEELDRKERGTIVMPYLNDKVLFQQVFHRPSNWWIRPRKYAFSFVFGESNSRNSGNDPRRVRAIFRDNWIRRNRSELGGLPVHLQTLNTSAISDEDVWTGLARYHESIFCPILAGDSAQQARFFDAMMAGCIPVVLKFKRTQMTQAYPQSWAANLPSWYRKNGEVTGAVYPFHNSLVDFGIDYDKCVLVVDARGNDDVMKIPGVLDRAIAGDMDRIREIQRNLQYCAQRTAFAMGSNAHQHDDAFSLIIQMLRYHLDGIGAS